MFFKHFLYNEGYKIVSDWEFFVYTICYVNVPYKYLGITISNFDFLGISSLKVYQHISIKERSETLKKYFPLFVDDYILVSQLHSKRVQQIFHIQKYNKAWKILKGFLNLILLFLPKIKK